MNERRPGGRSQHPLLSFQRFRSFLRCTKCQSLARSFNQRIQVPVYLKGQGDFLFYRERCQYFVTSIASRPFLCNPLIEFDPGLVTPTDGLCIVRRIEGLGTLCGMTTAP